MKKELNLIEQAVAKYGFDHVLNELKSYKKTNEGSDVQVLTTKLTPLQQCQKDHDGQCGVCTDSGNFIPCV